MNTWLKGRVKKLLISMLGYHRFLLAVFYWRRYGARFSSIGAEFSALAALADNERLILDVGANIGYTVAKFASVPSAGIYAFEPERDNIACLTRSVGRLANVVIVPCAVGRRDSDGFILPVLDRGIKQHALARVSDDDGNGSGGESVTIRAIDSFRTQVGRPIGLIKIDVEGFEVAVLHGMTDTVATDRPLIYVEVCGAESIVAFNNFCEEQHYTVAAWMNGRFRPLAQILESGNYLLSPQRG